MKNTPSLLRTGLQQAALLIGLGLCHGLAATATFTVTPSAVSNTYTGTITLQIGGLTNGETVVVQEFLDANTNGVINASDWLVQQFRLTDGVASVIGGVTNINVPGDSTPTNGAITAQMNFMTCGSGVPIAGRYLYKLSSPSSRFTPVTNLFSITNLDYPQSISGNVVCSGTNVPNALVMAFDGQPMNSNPVGGAIGNNAGGYTIPLPPGTYSLIAFKTNYVVNSATAPTLALGSGAKLGTNLSLMPTTRTISGTMVDAANSSIGLPGIWVFPRSTTGLMAVGISDTNGHFTARATASEWGIGCDSMQLPALGYARFQDTPQATTTAGNVAGLSIPMPKGTALFYGSVKDVQNRPLAGVRLYPYEDSNQYEAESVTDQNGNYAVAVLAGNWQIGPDNSSSPGYANYIFPQVGATIFDGRAVREDFVGVLATNRISGYLKDGSNKPISGVWVWAEATINGVSLHSGADTDATGHYAFNGCNGSWWVGVSCGEGDDNLGDEYLCPDSQAVTIANNNGTANFTALLAPSQISGTVKDNSNNPIANVMVYAYMPSGGGNRPGATTDGNGHYSFNVANGSWNVGLSCCGNQSLSPLGYMCVGEESTTVYNSSSMVNFSVPHATYQISGHLRDNSNNPIANVSVNASGNSYNACATTTSDGSYTLYVNSGDWYINLDCGVLNSLGYLCPDELSVVIAGASVVTNFTVQPCGQFQILTTSLPGGQAGFYYDFYLQATSCYPDFYWVLFSPLSSLPPGLQFDSSGALYGLPTTSGTFNFTVQVADGNNVTATQFLSLTIAPAVPDVSEYYLMKLGCFRQLDPDNLVADTTTGPFMAKSAVIQSDLGTVPIATLTLPAGGARVFPSGSTGIELGILDTYPSQAALDAVYTNGNYTFTLATLNSGYHYPVLTMPAASYPAPTRVSNFASAQAINPSDSFTLKWSNPADATTNDVIFVWITDVSGNVVFATPYPPTNHSSCLKGTATSTIVPANTLQLGGAYTGVIGFYRTTSVNRTAYPGAVGVTLVAVHTAFSLVAPSSLPVLSQPTRISNTQFGFLLSGAAGTSYTVLASTNAALPLANWSTVLVTNLPSSSAFIRDNQATSQQRFYRVKVGP